MRLHLRTTSRCNCRPSSHALWDPQSWYNEDTAVTIKFGFTTMGLKKLHICPAATSCFTVLDIMINKSTNFQLKLRDSTLRDWCYNWEWAAICCHLSGTCEGVFHFFYNIFHWNVLNIFAFMYFCNLLQFDCEVLRDKKLSMTHLYTVPLFLQCIHTRSNALLAVLWVGGACLMSETDESIVALDPYRIDCAM